MPLLPHKALLRGDPDLPIKRLFSAGQRGFWLDPSYAPSIFEDTAGTTPCITRGQVIGLIHDRSGNGVSATRATIGQRPKLDFDGNNRRNIAFDGSDDSIATASVNLSDTNKIAVICGVRKNVDTQINCVLGFGPTGVSVGCFEIFESDYGSGLGTTTFNAFTGGNAAFTGDVAPFTRVFAVVIDRSLARSAEVTIISNGITKSLIVSGADLTGNFGNQPFYIGRRAGASLPANMALYGLIVRAGGITRDELLGALQWMSNKTGVYA